MKIFSTLLLTLFFVFSSPLFAIQKDTKFRIIITKTDNQEYLPLIYKELKTLGIQEYVSKEGNQYYIYSQNFTSENEAMAYLKVVKSKFPSAAILQIDNTKKRFSIGLLGSVNLVKDDIDQKQGYGYGVNLQYDSNSFFTTLSLTSEDVDNYTLKNVTIAVDYFLFKSNFYAGIKGGYSILDTTGFTQSQSLLFGGNIGYRFQMSPNVDLVCDYSLLYGDHILEYTQGDELNIKLFHSFAFILNYHIF